MADGTKIQWTDASWNPIRARNKKTGEVGHYCELTSPGCAHCYASRFQARVGLPKFPGEGKLKPLSLVNERGAVPVSDDLEVFLDEKVLAQPLHWKKPRRIFACSMTDLFGDWVPDDWLNRCFEVMERTPQHTHQVLTKRAGRMRDYLSWRWGDDEGGRGHAGTPRIPARNIWCGVSVEDQARADERIPLLLQTPAAVRFISAEPLLGPVDLSRVAHPLNAAFPEYAATFNCFTLEAKSVATDRKGRPTSGRVETGKIDWCIIGGESGPGARPFNPSWAKDIIGQCRVAGVKCFMKQLGSNVLDFAGAIRDRKGGDPAEWSEDLRVREFPAAGA